MATVILMEWAGVTQNEYNQVMRNLDLDKNPPAGGILHVAGFTAGTLHVLDVWESQQAFEKFQKDRLNAAVQKAGIISQPKVNSTPSIIFTSRIWTSSARRAARRCRRQPEEHPRQRCLRRYRRRPSGKRDRRSVATGGRSGTVSPSAGGPRSGNADVCVQPESRHADEHTTGSFIES